MITGIHEAPCVTCRSISKEQPICPAPRIYTGEHWVVEHAYPSSYKGWLVVVHKQHKTRISMLERGEMVELGDLISRCSKALRLLLACEKEYVLCLCEAEGFSHLHWHIVGKPQMLPDVYKGAGILNYTKVSPVRPVIGAPELSQFAHEVQYLFD